MNSLSDAGLFEALAAAVTPAHVLTDADLIAGRLSEPRGLYHGRALALVRPGTTAEVAAVVAACAAAGVSIVTQGGNTGLVGGQTPDGTGRQIILSTARLDRIREIDPLTDTMIVEAGVTLAQAQEAALGADRLFPLSLASEGTCTIGGNLSTNAGGVAVIAYGNAREMATGFEAVLADGRIVNALSKLRKDNTGYDLKHLFFGAEGTLGVITAAALKLFPNPRSRSTAYVGLQSPERALDLLRLMRATLGTGVVSFELMPRLVIDIVLKHAPGTRDPMTSRHPWYVLMEVASQTPTGLDDAVAEALAEASEKGLADDAAIAASESQRADFWRIRESIANVQKYEGGSIKHDVSVPLGSVPAFLREAAAAVEAFVPGGRVLAFGHMGDGNIHFNLTQPVGADKEAFLRRWREVNEVVHAIVARYSGSFSAEHGIGQLKRDLLASAKDPVALDVMRKIKAALDPHGLMNPGKVL